MGMPTPHIEEPTHRFEVKADAPTHFAWLRTRLAAERSDRPDALAACLTAGLANIAAARRVRLTEVRCTVAGDIDHAQAVDRVAGVDFLSASKANSNKSKASVTTSMRCLRCQASPPRRR